MNCPFRKIVFQPQNAYKDGVKLVQLEKFEECYRSEYLCPAYIRDGDKCGMFQHHAFGNISSADKTPFETAEVS